MNIRQQNIRIIFGLKVKQLRQEKGLSFAKMSEATGMSVSYLNEIEKGKKFPKEDKIQTIASALEVEIEELLSYSMPRELRPVGELLSSNFLNELPLDMFGIELAKVIDIIANAPKRVGAFISTLVELGRNYALAEEHFYFGVLRSYMEMHNNYFEDIEKEVNTFTKKYKIPTSGKIRLEVLEKLLKKHFGYTIIEGGLKDFPELSNLRSVFVPKSKKLLLNEKLTDVQKAFVYGKELGFNVLGAKERANTSSLLKVNSFEEVLNHFNANYFSAALLLNKKTFIEDLQDFLNQSTWNGEVLTNLMTKYHASPEMLLQRMTNFFPKHFGLEKLFLLRFYHKPATDNFGIDKEIHLNQQHHPHGNGLQEHYCRRWISTSLLKDLHQMQLEGKYAETIVGTQISKYFGTDDTYFCITFARPAYPSPDKNVSTTIGILIDENVREKIKFLNDKSIQVREVNQTCERCPIKNCTDRAIEPLIVNAKNKRKKVEEALAEVLGSSS